MSFIAAFKLVITCLPQKTLFSTWSDKRNVEGNVTPTKGPIALQDEAIENQAMEQTVDKKTADFFLFSKNLSTYPTKDRPL